MGYREVAQPLLRHFIREEVVSVVPVARLRSSCAELAEERPEAGFNHIFRYVVHCPGSTHVTIGGPVGDREAFSDLPPITWDWFFC